MAVIKEKNKNKWTKKGNKWYFKCYYKDIQGNVLQKKSKMFAKQSEAEEAQRKFLNEVDLSVPTANITFKELIDNYLEYKKDKVKITTYNDTKKRFKKFQSLYKIKLSDFNIRHFEAWKKEINDNNKQYQTSYKNTLYKNLKALLNFAVKYYDMISLLSTMNKMSNFNNPNELKKEMSYFTYDEFKKFIDNEDNLKYKCFYEMLYYCGLRKGEANALNWNDINFDNKTVNINKNVTLKIKGEKYIIIPAKTNGSNRILPIPKKLLKDLKELQNFYKSYSNFNNSWFVFGGILPLQDTTIQSRKDEHCKKLGKSIRIHDFRHSCASLLINNGASINLVAKYLGHSKVSTTLNTYTHLFKNQFEEIVNFIDKLN